MADPSARCAQLLQSSISTCNHEGKEGPSDDCGWKQQSAKNPRKKLTEDPERERQRTSSVRSGRSPRVERAEAPSRSRAPARPRQAPRIPHRGGFAVGRSYSRGGAGNRERPCPRCPAKSKGSRSPCSKPRRRSSSRTLSRRPSRPPPWRPRAPSLPVFDKRRARSRMTTKSTDGKGDTHTRLCALRALITLRPGVVLLVALRLRARILLDVLVVRLVVHNQLLANKVKAARGRDGKLTRPSRARALPFAGRGGRRLTCPSTSRAGWR